MTQGRKFAYSYDNNGNQLTRSQKNGKTWTQAWDAENRLIEVSRTNGADSSVVTFKYDPFGRRIEKQIINSFNGDTISKTTHYVYDAEDIVLQIEEVTHDSTTTTTETRFIHGPGIDEPLAFVRDGQSYFYQADGLGSIVAITDSTQAIVQKYSYESFGLPTPQTTLQQPYMFTGREWDAEIGLYFYRARYYDPMEGRFVSLDPIKFSSGEVNLYNYVNGNVVNESDPLGLYRDIGGGFGLTLGGVGVSASIHTETCCDDQGRKHLRTIRTICLGLELGLGVKGSHGSSATLSDSKSPQKCPKLYDESGWFSEDTGVWGAIVIGRSHSTTSGDSGWKAGLGGGWNVYSGCKNDIIKDVIVGKCCE